MLENYSNFHNFLEFPLVSFIDKYGISIRHDFIARRWIG